MPQFDLQGLMDLLCCWFRLMMNDKEVSSVLVKTNIQFIQLHTGMSKLFICTLNKLEPKEQLSSSFFRGIWSPQYLPRLAVKPFINTSEKNHQMPRSYTRRKTVFFFHESWTTYRKSSIMQTKSSD